MSLDVALSILRPFDAIRKGEEIAINCPLCPERYGKVDTKHKMQINFSKGAAHCYRCEWGTKRLSKTLHVIVGKELADDLKEYVEVEDAPSWGDVLKDRARIPEGTILPKEAVPLFGDSKRNMKRRSRVVQYLRARGLLYSEITEFRLHAVFGTMTSALLIPCYGQSGALIYFYYKDIKTERYYYPSERSFQKPFPRPALPVGAGDILVGEDGNKTGHREVYVVEGFFDLVAIRRYGMYGVALGGKNITEEKAYRLRDLGMDKYILTLDPDVDAETVRSRVNTLGEFVGPDRVYVKQLVNSDPGEWLVDPDMAEDLYDYQRGQFYYPALTF